MDYTQTKTEFFQVGVVEDCNPTTYTVDVRLPGFGYLTAIPFLNAHGTPYGKDVTWLHSLRGASVLVAQVAGQHFVIGTLPTKVIDSDTTATVETLEAETAGINPAAYLDRGLHNYHAGRPQGMLPGDKVLRADDGETELGLYKGGLVRLRASAMSQFILGKIKDFARLIVRRLEIYTDFGEITATHDNQGRVGLRILGGADYSAETHPDIANWTLAIYLGDNPNDPKQRLHVQVTNPAQTAHALMIFDTDGKIIFDASSDISLNAGADILEDATAERRVSVGTDDSTTIGGNASTNITGNCVLAADGSMDLAGQAGVEVDGGGGTIDGVVTGQSICPFTGGPHPDKSGSVKASN